MTFDVSGLTEVKMRGHKDRKFSASRYYDSGSNLVAKTCVLCGSIRVVSEFNPHRTTLDRLRNGCKVCESAVNCGNKDAWRERKLVTEPDYDQKVMQRHRAANSGRDLAAIGEIQRVLYPADMKECRKCKNMCALAEFWVDRERKDGLSNQCRTCGDASRAERKTKPYRTYWESHGIPYQCYITGETLGLHSDHVIPEALKGPDDAYNRLPLRGDLNCSKSDTPLLPWLLQRRDLDEYGPRGLILLRVLSYGVWPFLESPEYVSEHWDEWSENADNIYDEWLADKEAASVP